jgi:NAD(P)-dependent dehydrogenase (short-subunit alcohol dehydrogenase family)
MINLEGRTAIVTGGARGIGGAITEALAVAGARVTVCDLLDDVVSVAGRLRADGHRVEAIVADVSSPYDVRRLVDAAGPVDLLVNNAGVVRRTPPTDEWEKAVADFDAVIGPNLRGPYLVGRAVIPGMVARGGGDIVNLATDHIHTCGWPTSVDHADAPGCPWRDQPRRPGGGASSDLYDAAKWGLNGLAQAWAAALRPHGVRVNNVCVGATDTEMLRSFLRGDPDPAVVATWFRPDQVAALVLDLLREGPTGRSGDNIGVWVGHPLALPPPGATSLDYDPRLSRIEGWTA